jgi:hypothetical protein
MLALLAVMMVGAWVALVAMVLRSLDRVAEQAAPQPNSEVPVEREHGAERLAA